MGFKNKQSEDEAAMPGNPECDPAKLAPINEFDARECPDGIYRNRWGCRFCSVEGCGLVSDMVLGGKEVCVFHAAAQGYEAEMTEVMRLYRPLIILAKGYDKLPNMTYLQRDENGLTVADELFEEFKELVRRSGFYRIPQGQVPELPLPKGRHECTQGTFVTPFVYVLNGCVSHASALAAARDAKRSAKTNFVNASIARVNRLRERVRSLGATWRNATKNNLATTEEWF